MHPQNLHALTQAFPHIAGHLAQASPPPQSLELHPTPDGAMTAKYRGRFLHSQRAPLEEAERLATYICREAAEKSSDTLLFFGMGLGYHIDSCIKKDNPGSIYVIEPDIELFQQVLTLHDVSFILEFTGLRLCIDIPVQEIIDLLQKDGIQNPYVIQPPVLTTSKSAYFHRANEAIDRFKRQTRINNNTLERFGKLWVKNLLQNLPTALSAQGIESTGSLFAEFPVVLCAAGPTLDQILPLLPKLQQSAIIIAVDTALTAMLSTGIEPDFLVVIDPQYWNTRHLDRSTLQHTIVVSDLSTHPRTFRLLSQPLLLSASIFPLGKRFDPPQRISLGAGGSVATAAWDFSRHLGTRELYCAGLDMGFAEKRTHARQSFYEYYWHNQEQRLCPVEGQLVAQLFSGNPFLSTAYDGSAIQSDQRMELYYWWLHDRIGEQKTMRTFSLSPHSRKITGVELRIPEDLQLPPCRAAIKKKMQMLRRTLQRQTQAGKGSTATLQELYKECINVEHMTTKGLQLCRQFMKARQQPLRQKILSQLASLDQQFLRHVSKDLFGFLMQKVSEQIFQKNDHQSAIHNSILMYQSLYQSVQFHKAQLQKYITP